MKTLGPLLRLILAGLAVGLLSQCSSITPTPTIAFTDHRHSMLFADLEYEDTATGDKVVVPAGFVTDYASIPLSVRHYFEVGGEAYQYPAVVHDWLYWSQTLSREKADLIFDHAMKDCGVGDVKRATIWSAVRVGGDNAWEKNQKKKAEGWVKVIPAAYRNPRTWPKNVSWPAYRQWLREQGVKDGGASESVTQ